VAGGGPEGKVWPIYGTFGLPKKAQSHCIARNVANIQRAASEREEVTTKETRFPDGTVKTEKTVRKVIDWCAAAWYLERTCSKEFGRPHKPETTDEKKKPKPLVVKGEGDPDEL
jgi:hypothetical protein